jgi:hypothetical protein
MGATMSPAGEHGGGEDYEQIHGAGEDATGGGRQGLGLLVVSLGHHARGAGAPRVVLPMHARAGEQGSRGSWPRVLADERARPAPVVLDAALLGFAAGRLDVRVDAALERVGEREVCGSLGTPARGGGGGGGARADGLRSNGDRPSETWALIMFLQKG